MLFRCRHCGHPVGKGHPLGGDYRVCANCYAGRHQAGLLKIANTRMVACHVKEQLRRSGKAESARMGQRTEQEKSKGAR